MKKEKNHGPYSIIYADAPWHYHDKQKPGNRGAGFKYKTMKVKDIVAMREEVDGMAAEDCTLFMWATLPMLLECLTVIKAWGFRYRTVGFVWIKTTSATDHRLGLAIRKALGFLDGPIRKLLRPWGLDLAITKAIEASGLIVLALHFGGGRWTRANAEICIIANRGSTKRINASVRQVVIAPRTKEHSEKPDEVRKRIVELMGDLPRIELFCRHAPEGWATHGDQVGKLVKAKEE